MILRQHCAHARFVYNLGNEQRLEWRPGRGPTPGYLEQKRQLTEARAAEPWLAAGSATVQQEALRDLDQAWRNFFAGSHRRPGWRKQGSHEGFRVVGVQARRVQELSRRWSRVLVPKVGWVRFRRSRAVPDAKSYRVTRDPAGRWHIAFAVVPELVPGPGTGEIVGIDRGVAASMALSTGELLLAPRPSPQRQQRLVRLQRKFARAKRGSNRRARVRDSIAGLCARDKDARKDWAEKASTDIARRFDVIRIEDLRIDSMSPFGQGNRRLPRPPCPPESQPEPGDQTIRLGAVRVSAWRIKLPVGWKRSTRVSPRSVAARAGMWTRSRARAKRASCALPATSPAMLT